MKIQSLFKEKKKNEQKTFIAYITAGDRSFDETTLYIQALIEAGVDIVELGVPFSDPVADGPVNQKAAARALDSGTSLEGILNYVSRLRKKSIGVPLVLFTYFNPLFKMGMERFAALSKQAGIDGVLIVDLPPEEAEREVRQMQDAGLDTIFLASPTTSDDRLPAVARLSSGFVYFVSRTGVTGVQAALSKSLDAELSRLKPFIHLPLAVGFGISTPEQAHLVSRMADAVVVGSAFVKLIEESKDPQQAAGRIKELARSMVRAIQR